MNAKYIIGGILIILTLTACGKNDEPDIACDKTVILDEDQYINGPDDLLNFNEITIDQNCLIIDFSSSGCDGSTWEIKLLDAGIVKYSNPPQRNLRLSLKNDEPCDAYFKREISFDISQLQVKGSQVNLILRDWDAPLMYRY